MDRRKYNQPLMGLTFQSQDSSPFALATPHPTGVTAQTASIYRALPRAPIVVIIVVVVVNGGGVVTSVVVYTISYP